MSDVKNKLVFLYIFFSIQLNAQFKDDLNKTIIAFGEASHGDATVYNLREKLIDEALNFTNSNIDVLIEMPQGATYEISKYYKNEIDSTQLLKSFDFYGLQTNAFLHLINKYKFEKRISFYGVDMQNQILSFKHIDDILNNTSLNDWSSVKKKIKNLNVNFYQKLINSSNRDSCYKQLKEDYLVLIDYLKKNKTILTENEIINYFNDIELPLQVIEQCLHYAFKYYDTPMNAARFRDSCMAANIISIDSNSKSLNLFFAANFHVSKMIGSCGWHLSNSYSDNYFSIGHQFYKGEVLVAAVHDGKMKPEIKPFVANKWGLPHKLMKCTKGGYYNFSNIVSRRLKKNLSRRTWFLDIGAILDEKNSRKNYFRIEVMCVFDALYFSEKNSASLFLL